MNIARRGGPVAVHKRPRPISSRQNSAFKGFAMQAWGLREEVRRLPTTDSPSSAADSRTTAIVNKNGLFRENRVRVDGLFKRISRLPGIAVRDFSHR